MATLVNVDNFVRAETDRMFAALSAQAPINVLAHHREPASIENQPVIRQNRDTLYSSAIVDIAEGATLSLPDAGGRYLSVMVVNNDHYINDVFHDVGEHELTVDRSTPTTCSSPHASWSTPTTRPISKQSTRSRTRSLCGRSRRDRS